MKYAIANWKMNLPPEGIDGYMRAVCGAQREKGAIVVAPPFPFLRDVAAQAKGIEVAAQNASDHDKGAFTGEVAPAMIRYCGVRYVILGHSERRQLYGEVQRIVAEDLPYINLWYFDNVVVHSARVRNVHLGSAGNYDFLTTVELAH